MTASFQLKCYIMLKNKIFSKLTCTRLSNFDVTHGLTGDVSVLDVFRSYLELIYKVNVKPMLSWVTPNLRC